jgi:DHA1 family bicyclomycin/chloramphenicol resistance-like MFS transporter
MSATSLPRAAAPPILLLVLLASIQPFALNVIAPATPALAKALSAEFSTIALSLTLYLYAVAATQLVAGPMSDRHGRRPIILIALGVYIAGSLVGVYAGDATMLILARMLQGAGAGSVFALVRAIIRDTASRDAAASRLGYVMTMMVAVPMFAPGIGGLIDAAGGWQAIFWTMVGIGVASLAVTFALLAETHAGRDPDASVRTLVAGFPILLQSPRFVALTLALMSTGMLFFSFIGASPYIVVEHMSGSAEIYGFWFIIMSFGYMLGNFLVGRFVGRFGALRLITIGTALALAGGCTVTLSLITFGWKPAALFVPMMLCSLGNGLTMPSATAAALSVRPDLTGSAAGLSGAIQLGMGATASALTGYGVVRSPWALVATILVAGLIGVAGSFAARRVGMEADPR